MRHLAPWVLSVSLLVLLFLICGCAHRPFGISLELAALGGLAIHATVLLWAHRHKLHALLSSLPVH